MRVRRSPHNFLRDDYGMDLNGKRILVIGGAGLIGSHVVDQLVQTDVA